MTPKLFKAADVCEIAHVQPYVLRSWEKEFPGIGVQKSPEAPRFYRQSDVDQVLRIKQLVFGEGLTVAGARRRLEESAPAASVSPTELAEAVDALGADARTKIAGIRDGLRAIHALLEDRPGAFMLEPPPNGAPKRTIPTAPLRVTPRRKTSEGSRSAANDHAASKTANPPGKRRRAHA
jgi:DNA-binding transcriptional MerR regulator